MRLLLLMLLTSGCASSTDSGDRDAGERPMDAGPVPDDTGRPDAGMPDGGPPLVDAGPGLGTCAACAAHAECGPRAYCASLTGGATACVPACNPDLPMCPRGFRCLLDVAAGVPEPTCLPVGERCCVDEDGDDRGTGIGCRGADCDDTDATVHEGAAEICDAAAVDHDCDGTANDGCDCADGATRACTLPGACAAGVETCAGGAWGACSVAPVEETCNAADDDCDGTIDEGVTRTFYPDADADGDGAADPSLAVIACDAPPAHVAIGGDCDDADPAVSSRATERCDCPLADENCNGLVDEGCGCSCGPPRACGSSSIGACRLGSQMCVAGAWSSCTGAVEPITETCNGADDDCDGTTDEAPAASSCPISASVCTGGACACAPGAVVCADGSRCIAAGECCTDADCADGLCTAGRCRAGLGCATGRRRGFLDEAAWPNVAACGTRLGFPEATAAAATVCAAGWRACTASEIGALAGPVPAFAPADASAWVAYTDSTTTWWSQHSDAACGPPTVYANLRGTGSCTPSGVFPEGWRLIVSAATWPLSHQTATGCIAHTAHACGYPGGSIGVHAAYTLCCR